MTVLINCEVLKGRKKVYSVFLSVGDSLFHEIVMEQMSVQGGNVNKLCCLDLQEKACSFMVPRTWVMPYFL